MWGRVTLASTLSKLWVLCQVCSCTWNTMVINRAQWIRYPLVHANNSLQCAWDTQQGHTWGTEPLWGGQLALGCLPGETPWGEGRNTRF